MNQVSSVVQKFNLLEGLGLLLDSVFLVVWSLDSMILVSFLNLPLSWRFCRHRRPSFSCLYLLNVTYRMLT